MLYVLRDQQSYNTCTCGPRSVLIYYVHLFDIHLHYWWRRSLYCKSEAYCVCWMLSVCMCLWFVLQQTESGYGSLNSLRRQGSLISITSANSISNASTSSFKVFQVHESNSMRRSGYALHLFTVIQNLKTGRCGCVMFAGIALQESGFYLSGISEFCCAELIENIVHLNSNLVS